MCLKNYWLVVEYVEFCVGQYNWLLPGFYRNNRILLWWNLDKSLNPQKNQVRGPQYPSTYRLPPLHQTRGPEKELASLKKGVEQLEKEETVSCGGEVSHSKGHGSGGGGWGGGGWPRLPKVWESVCWGVLVGLGNKNGFLVSKIYLAGAAIRPKPIRDHQCSLRVHQCGCRGGNRYEKGNSKIWAINSPIRPTNSRK